MREHKGNKQNSLVQRGLGRRVPSVPCVPSDLAQSFREKDPVSAPVSPRVRGGVRLGQREREQREQVYQIVAPLPRLEESTSTPDDGIVTDALRLLAHLLIAAARQIPTNGRLMSGQQAERKAVDNAGEPIVACKKR